VYLIPASPWAQSAELPLAMYSRQGIHPTCTKLWTVHFTTNRIILTKEMTRSVNANNKTGHLRNSGTVWNILNYGTEVTKNQAVLFNTFLHQDLQGHYLFSNCCNWPILRIIFFISWSKLVYSVWIFLENPTGVTVLDRGKVAGKGQKVTASKYHKKR